MWRLAGVQVSESTDAIMMPMTERATIRRRAVACALLFSLYFPIVVALQWRSNAFRSELAGTADEPAHYVTGLLIHDYISAGIPGNPISYARNFYAHYPKVALGHWPPFFYVVQAAWTLPFTPSRTSVILLMAALTALLATVLCQTIWKEFSLGAGIAVAILLLSLPVIEEFSTLVMSEILLTLLVLSAVLAYGRYLDTERWQSAAWFGVWATLALLTKATGIELAFVPLCAVLAGRRWRLLRRFSFWLPAILVVGIAGPWYLWVPGAQHESVIRFGAVQFVFFRLTATPKVWWEMLGVAPAILAIAGLRIFRGPASGKWLSGLSVLLGAYVFRFLVGAWEDRHLVTGVPILLMFSVAGATWLLSRISARWKIAIVGAAVAALVGFNISRSPLKRHYGYDEAAQKIVSNPQFAKSVVLVCGAAIGEGALISEIAMRESRPGHYVLRATKLLAISDWMGWNYRALFNNPADTMQYVEAIPAGIVVIDGDGRSSPHGRLLFEGLRHHPEKWDLLADDGGILVFHLIGHESRPVAKIPIPVPSTEK
ncbi:MAG TPA: glycosyltransferase family 39 protein [Bryobacteraceae bacterium]